ncbi:hypothetical protein C8035_v002005 [Colletotrichum spinosum]|uniref:Uncharacterized protein n=1 Tax=Colletotrichum spinosum TaxID=1347390 RepID=A0A4R8PY55_9PEZI|nr:hypothetical protein C8035_v002005 [Colletotrichum spinosum]
MRRESGQNPFVSRTTTTTPGPSVGSLCGNDDDGGATAVSRPEDETDVEQGARAPAAWFKLQSFAPPADGHQISGSLVGPEPIGNGHDASSRRGPRTNGFTFLINRGCLRDAGTASSSLRGTT